MPNYEWMNGEFVVVCMREVVTPEEQGIPSFTAFDRLSTSSVKSTTVGNVGCGRPRIGGCARDMCVLYQAVPTRIACALNQTVIDLRYRTTSTSVVAVIWSLSHFMNHGGFSSIGGIVVTNQFIVRTSEIRYKTSKYGSHPTSLTP